MKFSIEILKELGFDVDNETEFGFGLNYKGQYINHFSKEDQSCFEKLSDLSLKDLISKVFDVGYESGKDNYSQY